MLGHRTHSMLKHISSPTSFWGARRVRIELLRINNLVARVLSQDFFEHSLRAVDSIKALDLG